jgi:glycosidase
MIGNDTTTGERHGDQRHAVVGEADPDRAWWKEAVVYQVYPRSFNDTDGDGVGDLPGVIEKVEYLDDLGVDVVWLNPVYASPQADNGYDVSDYRAINPEYGTMADWEALRDALHERDIRVVMDLVLNHTSDQHEWFQRSRDPDSEYHDYYHWVDGDPDEPPNDWDSFFGGSAWTYDDAVGKWYLHLFDETQPDLNWENPAVRREGREIVEFWLEKGIDGFRLDVIDLLSKPPGYPDGEREDAVVHGADKFVDGPRLDEYYDELFEALVGYDVMTVGEMVELPLEKADRFVGEDGPMDMAITFDHMRLDHGPNGRWDRREWQMPELREAIGRWQEGLEGGWNCLYMGNHDQPRMVSRFGSEQHRRASATLLATLLTTLSGTPFIYQGDEIGMTNYPFDSLEEVRDVDTIGNVEQALARGNITEDEVVPLVRSRSRDNARTPVQWDDSPNAGFTDPDVEPWMPVNPDHETVNVAAAREDPDSVWHHYRRLLANRDADDLFVYGDYRVLTDDHPRLWAYERTLGGERAVVLLNFGDDPLAVTPAAEGISLAETELLLANYDVDADTTETFTMRPWEARVYRS